MTKTKCSKSKWWAVLLGIVAVAAMGVTLWLVLSPKQEPAVMELVEEQDPALAPGNTSYLIAGGLDHSASLPTPMPYYGFSMPEGYTHTCNGEESANRLSKSYTDQYRSPQGGSLTLHQQPAYYDWNRSGTGTFREMQFGGTKVVCRMAENSSSAYWIYHNSVLELTADWAMDENQLLELVSRMDYDANRQPIYSDLVFRQEDGTYFLAGNPQLPDQLGYYDFPQPPQGFSAYLSNEESGDGNYRYYSAFSTANGDTDQLEVHTYSSGTALFAQKDNSEPASSHTVQQVTINGKEGLFYQSGNYTEVVWLEGDVAVGLSYTAYTNAGTLERLEEYAQSLERCRPVPGS